LKFQLGAVLAPRAEMAASWITRAVALIPALYLLIQWQSIGAYWPALLTWLVCLWGAELIIEVTRRSRQG
jgi:hypothetical protein